MALKAVKVRGVPLEDQGDIFDASKRAKIADWRAFGVVAECSRETLPQNHQVIGVRFICVYKDKGGQQLTPTARLVALGYQETVGSDPVDAPTASRLSFKAIALLTAGAGNNWPLLSIDFKRAFFQARDRSPSDPVLAIELPIEAGVAASKVWILRKSVYGLRSAPREWWLTVYNALREIGFTQFQSDLTDLFYKASYGDVVGAIAVHVDEVLGTGSRAFENVLRRLQQRFQTRDRAVNSFTHLGIQVDRSPDGKVLISQSRYIDSLQVIHIPDHSNQLPRDAADATRALIGGLLWLAAGTRVDVAAEVSTLASNMSDPTISSAVAANKLLHHFQATKAVKLVLPRTYPYSIAVFADAALQSRPGRRSQGGHIICVKTDRGDAYRLEKRGGPPGGY